MIVKEKRTGTCCEHFVCLAKCSKNFKNRLEVIHPLDVACPHVPAGAPLIIVALKCTRGKNHKRWDGIPNGIYCTAHGDKLTSLCRCHCPNLLITFCCNYSNICCFMYSSASGLIAVVYVIWFKFVAFVNTV